jgi:hypothetical protein
MLLMLDERGLVVVYARSIRLALSEEDEDDDDDKTNK